jgi:Arc/MetJ-type ribon-helix-helix transcriptional regulator
MRKNDALRRAPQIHIRVSEDDEKKLDELVNSGGDPFNSRGAVIRHLIRMAYKDLKDLQDQMVDKSIKVALP